MADEAQSDVDGAGQSALDDLARVRRVAEVHNVTPQTVRNWAKSGMAAVCQRGVAPDGSALFSLKEVAKWIEMNTGKLHGGRRRGAGKKPDSVTVPAMYEQVEQSVPETEIVESEESIDALMALASQGKLPLARVASIKEFLAARLKQLELDKALGNVVDSRDVADVWTRYVIKWRTGLEAMVGRLASELSVIVERPEKTAVIRNAVQAEIDRVLEGIRNDSEFAVPKKRETR